MLLSNLHQHKELLKDSLSSFKMKNRSTIMKMIDNDDWVSVITTMLKNLEFYCNSGILDYDIDTQISINLAIKASGVDKFAESIFSQHYERINNESSEILDEFIDERGFKSNYYIQITENKDSFGIDMKVVNDLWLNYPEHIRKIFQKLGALYNSITMDDLELEEAQKEFEDSFSQTIWYKRNNLSETTFMDDLFLLFLD